MTTAFVGLGRMGRAIAEAAILAGHEVRLFDLDPSVAQELAGPRATPAGSLAEAATGCDTVIVTVNDDAQVRAAVTGLLPGAAAGTAVLIHATIGHDTLREVAATAAGSGVLVLDAGISGAKGHYSIPELAVMVGGDADALDRARPVLSAYASLVVHLGPLGAGLDAKLALNVLRYLCFVSHIEAIRLAGAAGIGDAFTELVNHVGAADYLGNLGHGNYPESVERRQTNVRIAQKDLAAAAARAGEIGIDLPLSAAADPHLHHIWHLTADLSEAGE